MTKIHDRIRQALEASPALTQKGLAARMGLNPAAVNRMLHGQRKIMAEEIPVIESYIGQRLDPAPRAAPEAPIPAYRLDSAKPFTPEHAVDWLPRHPAQGGGPEAFAVFVTDDSMSPRYRAGEIAYIHPGRPPREGEDVLALSEKEKACLAGLKKDGGESLHLALLDGSTRKISRQAVRALYAVVGRG